jgi:HEAT repeat protein
VLEGLDRRLREAGTALERLAAARALVETGRPERLDRVARAIAERPGEEGPGGGFALGAARLLASAGEPARPRLVALLGSDSETVRAAGIEGLIVLGGPGTREPLAALLDAEDPAARRQAAAALARLGDLRAIPALREAHRKERDPALRGEYARAARSILGPAAGEAR